MFFRLILPVTSMFIATLLVAFGHDSGTKTVNDSRWVISLNVGTENEPELLPVLIRIDAESANSTEIRASIINGEEEIRVGPVSMKAGKLVIEIPHYASTISLDTGKGNEPVKGVWSKVRGAGKVFQVPCQAKRWQAIEWDDPADFVGRWSVKFEDSEDPAVGVFRKAGDSNQVYGTFLTTTGDYRYLAGGVRDGKLQLSCFDGAHAFLFNIRNTDNGLEGSFHSGNWYKTTWTATRDDDAALPDAFGQTTWTDRVKLEDLKFPDLEGTPVSLADEQFVGKCRIIEVFGSWCPNCHDAGVYLTELHEKYADDGLSIVGLAFELTGDFDTDVAQVRTFIERNQTKYPILIAGTSDKGEATEQLKVLDRVRSYPTMIFLDQASNVKAIYTGFSGPATGQAHATLRRQFEKTIEKILND